MLEVDSREQDVALKAGCDAVVFLGYKLDGDPANYSYDIRLTTASGQILRGERKACLDAIASFADGKLERQLANVDFLVCEWDDAMIYMESQFRDSKWRAMAEGCQKRLWKLSMRGFPILWTGDVAGTLRALRYLEKQTEVFPHYVWREVPE